MEVVPKEKETKQQKQADGIYGTGTSQFVCHDFRNILNNERKRFDWMQGKPM